MIGFYDYTVILTFLSVVSSVIGMTRAMQGYFRAAIVLLALSGLFDTFDGKVARTKKNRTADEKLYGIQLDSLADVICFGVFPSLICYLMGMRGIFDIIILCAFVLCGVIRLAYFNVLETNRQSLPESGEKVFHGLPITTSSILLPLVFLSSFFISGYAFVWVLRVTMVFLAAAFVTDFTMRKPTNKEIALIILVVGLAALSTWLFSRYRLPHQDEPEEPIVEVDCEEIEEWLAG